MIDLSQICLLIRYFFLLPEDSGLHLEWISLVKLYQNDQDINNNYCGEKLSIVQSNEKFLVTSSLISIPIISLFTFYLLTLKVGKTRGRK